MKIQEYNEMMKYLTRKKDNSEGAFKKEVERQKANGTYGPGNKIDPPILKDNINKIPTQPHLPGMEPKTIINKLEKYEDDYVGKRGQQTVSLVNTANKLKGKANKDDYLLKEDGNGLMVNKNKTIAVRDSFVAKQFNKALGVDEPMATPEQVGKLAERLERNAQMTGGKGPFTKTIKKKKPITTPEPIKINLDDYKPFVEPPRIEADPRSKIMEARFKEIVRKNEEEKSRRETSGLAGLLNTGKKFI